MKINIEGPRPRPKLRKRPVSDYERTTGCQKPDLTQARLSRST